MSRAIAAGDGPGDGPAEADAATPAFDEAVAAAFAFLLKSTAARPQTEAEVRAKLRRREVPDAVADAALDRARRAGAIDDAVFARMWVQDRGCNRGYGRARLRRELAARGVAGHLVEDALGALDGRSDADVATDLARKRFATFPATVAPEAAARRLVGYLARRGYPQGLAQRVAFEVSGLDRSWD